MDARALTVDEASHTYRFGGALVPGVTCILRPLANFAGIPPDVLEAKANLGRRVHFACQLDDEQDRIYAMSKSGSLAVVDARVMGVLTLMGSHRLPGEPFEMVRRGNVLLTLSNRAVTGAGELDAPGLGRYAHSASLFALAFLRAQGGGLAFADRA